MANGENRPSFGIGVDIGGTKVLTLVGDRDGNIVFKEKITTPNSLPEIIMVIKSCLASANLNPNYIAGMGVGFREE